MRWLALLLVSLGLVACATWRQHAIGTGDWVLCEELIAEHECRYKRVGPPRFTDATRTPTPLIGPRRQGGSALRPPDREPAERFGPDVDACLDHLATDFRRLDPPDRPAWLEEHGCPRELFADDDE